MQLDAMLADPSYGVQAINFADGTVWTRQQVIALSGATGSTRTIYYNAGAGHVEFNQQDWNQADDNVLQLGDGITPASVTTSTDGNGNLYLNIGSSGDRVQLDGMFASAAYGVGRVQFADGAVWTRQQAIAMAMTGTSGNDILYGTSGADVFDGKGGNDYEQGNGGNDTFIFNAGYGQLRISEQDWNPAAHNVLALGAGITPDAVHATSDGDGNVFLTIGSNGDRVQIDSMLASPVDGVQSVQFADGTVWSRAQIIAKLTVGTPGNDILYGTTGADVFDGKGGNDYEQGNGGNDTFIFNAGYGQLRISEQDFNPAADNILRLGTGIVPASVVVSADGDGNLFLTLGGNGDRIQLDGMFASAVRGVQSVQFADGTLWTRQQMIAMEMTGSSGNDVLYGTTGADVIDGKGGNDYEQGNGGNDTFIFNAGYGQLRINEQDWNPAAHNVLQLGAGIAPGSVAASSDGNGNLILNIGSNGDRIEIDGMLANAVYGIQAIDFADGTAWTRAQVFNLATTVTSADHTITGTAGDDLLDGKGGTDRIAGGGGYDTYFFRRGYGPLAIDNSTPGGTAASGELDFGSGITDQNLWFNRSGSDLVASLMGTSNAVTIDGWFGSNPSAELSAIKTVDGLRLDTQVAQLVAAMATYSAGNTGFDVTQVSQIPTDSNLQTAIAAAWHH
ncbi:MAG: hypothetical protein JOZ40_07610 [Methylobacteriaceae bacterium]|nr:hypothetical protein [Methylobacteriaceae bacterium]